MHPSYRPHHGVDLRRSILAMLGASGILPGCAAATNPDPTANGSPVTSTSSGVVERSSSSGVAESGTSSGSGQTNPVATATSTPPDNRPAPQMESKRSRVCSMTNGVGNGAKVLACRDTLASTPKSSLRPCVDYTSCDKGEFCEQDEHGQHVCTHLIGQTLDCASDLDCVEGTRCVLPTRDAARGECTSDACGPSCTGGTLCAPIWVHDSAMDDDFTGPAPPDNAGFRFGGLRCMPAAANTFESHTPPSGMCRVSIATNCAVSEGQWQCTLSGGLGRHPCGRPLLVDGSACTAAPESTGESDALVRRVRAIAYDEHASIVAFSRAITQLAALGAPLALLKKTSAALADEIEHARLAFVLLRSLEDSAEDERPGAFPEALSSLGDPASLRRALLEDTVRGGAIGESGSVLDALGELESAPPAVRAFFDRIIEDETRHAALAFETIAWLAGEDAGLWRLVDETMASVPRGPLVETVVRPILSELRATAIGA